MDVIGLNGQRVTPLVPPERMRRPRNQVLLKAGRRNNIDSMDELLTRRQIVGARPRPLFTRLRHSR